MPPAQRPAPRDDGFTLVELLVYVVLLGVILAAGFGLLTNSFRGSNNVSGSAEASRDGQTIARTITTSVRNASHVSVNASGTVLTARTATGECVAWKVDGTTLSAHFPYGGTGTTPVAVPAGGWTVLSDAVRRTAPTVPFFAPADGGVAVRFTVDTATAPTLIDTLAVPRLLGSGSSRCLV